MADYYGSLAEALAYHADRGNTAWAAASTDDLREQALVRASAYIDGAYRSQFPGLRTDGRDQVLEWPRAGAEDQTGYGILDTEIPVEITNAVYEGALRELATPGSLNPDIEAGSRVLKRRKTGPLESEWAVNGSTEATFRRIEEALGPLIGLPSPYFGRVARG